MANGKGRSKWRKRRAQDRSPKRVRHRQGPREREPLPPCSYKDCPNGRPASTHILRKGDGTFFSSCDDCIQPMMHALKLEGIDVQVANLNALEHLADTAEAQSEPK